jgi:two-component system, cell cycle sensor histidine kinase and response regulator CckA
MPKRESSDKILLSREREQTPAVQDVSYRLLFERNPQPMWVYDVESLVFLAVNEAAVDHYGYSRAEFLGMTIRDIRPAQDIPILLEAVSQEVAGVERKHRKKSGALMDVEVTSQNLSWAGRAARLVSITDITLRKRTEERIRESEESYRRLVEQSPDAILVHRRGTIVFANAACAALFGAVSVDEIVGKQYLDFVHPTNRAVVQKRIQQFSRDLEFVRRNETAFVRCDGGEISAEVMARSVIYRAEPAVQVMFRDISEKKKARYRLQRSEANLAAAQRLAHLGSFEFDLTDAENQDNVPVEWSDEVFRMFGYEPGQIAVTRADIIRALHPDDRERFCEVVAKAIEERRPYCLDYRIIRRDGSERFIHGESEVICDEDTGKPLRIRGTAQDITERKHAEERMRRLALAVDHSSELIAMSDCGGHITFANQALLGVLGYSEEEIIGKSFQDTILSPHNPPSLDEDIRRAVLAKGGWKGECLHCRKDGGDFPVYLSLQQVTDSTAAPIGTVGIAQDITERKKAEEKFYKAFNANPEPISIATISEGRYIDVNESFLRITGYQRAEVIGRTSQELNFWAQPEDRARFVEILNSQGSVRDLKINFRTKSGKLRAGLDSAEIIDIAGQQCVIAICKDVTETNVLEKQLLQAQKMEAVGRLSGGIAHDFNNLLSVIIGYSEILEEHLEESSKFRKNATEIRKAGQRAASLTRQLLAFSRQQVLEPRVLGLNAVVIDMEKMLRRLIGEDVELITVLAPDLWNIKADQTQMAQVLMNLIVNARDAMPNGGKVTVETENIEVDDVYARQHGHIFAGPFVMLTVSDSGSGMDAETQSHIFEPFFTTKERGKGTGLGLATVYGVIKQSGGFIWVYSEPGHGASFKILLPRVDESVQSAPENVNSQRSGSGSETVLVVEDDACLRELTISLLAKLGYKVFEAANGPQALNIARQKSRGQIHLLLTDVVMPGMSGPAVAGEVISVHPDIRVLYMSGYTEFAVGHQQITQKGQLLLQKPFTQQELARKVRQALDASCATAPVASPIT